MRMLETPIVRLSHTIVSLGVHEEGQETIYFNSKTMKAKKERIEQGLEDTKFTEWYDIFFKSWNKYLKV